MHIYLAHKIPNFLRLGGADLLQLLPGGQPPGPPLNAPRKRSVCSLRSQLFEPPNVENLPQPMGRHNWTAPFCKYRHCILKKKKNCCVKSLKTVKNTVTENHRIQHFRKWKLATLPYAYMGVALFLTVGAREGQVRFEKSWKNWPIHSY